MVSTPALVTVDVMTTNMGRLTRRLLIHQLAANPDDAWLTAVWRTARLSGDDDIVNALLSHRRLPEVVIAEGRQLKEPRTRVTFLSNRALPTDVAQTEIRAERRAAVLASLLTATASSLRSVPHPHRQLVIDEATVRMQTRPTKALAEALLTVDDLPVALAALVATQFLPDAGATLSSHRHSRYRRLLGDLAGSDHAAALTAQAANSDDYRILLGDRTPANDPEWRQAMMMLIATPLVRLSPPGNSGAWQHGTVDRVAADLNRLLNTDAAPTWFLDTALRCIQQAANLHPDHRTRLIAVVKKNQPVPDVHPDADVLRDVVRDGSDTETDVLIATHPDMTVDERADALHRLPANVAVALAPHLPVDLVRHIAITRTTEFLNADLLHLLGDDETAVARELLELRLSRSDVDSDRSHGFTFHPELVLAQRAGRDGLRRLPWKLLAQQAAWSFSGDLPCNALLIAEQQTVLGNDIDRWQLFVSLAEQFNGTAGELFDLVEGLTSGSG